MEENGKFKYGRRKREVITTRRKQKGTRSKREEKWQEVQRMEKKMGRNSNKEKENGNKFTQGEKTGIS